LVEEDPTAATLMTTIPTGELEAGTTSAATRVVTTAATGIDGGSGVSSFSITFSSAPPHEGHLGGNPYSEEVVTRSQREDESPKRKPQVDSSLTSLKGSGQTLEQIQRGLELNPMHPAYWIARGLPFPDHKDRIEVAKQRKLNKETSLSIPAAGLGPCAGVASGGGLSEITTTVVNPEIDLAWMSKGQRKKWRKRQQQLLEQEQHMQQDAAAEQREEQERERLQKRQEGQSGQSLLANGQTSDHKGAQAEGPAVATATATVAGFTSRTAASKAKAAAKQSAARIQGALGNDDQEFSAAVDAGAAALAAVDKSTALSPLQVDAWCC